MSYPFILETIPMQYHRNNYIASCCNYCSENFQYHPTLIYSIMIIYYVLLLITFNPITRDRATNGHMKTTIISNLTDLLLGDLTNPN